MAKLELKIDAREVWSAYADRLYSGDKVVKSVTEMLQNSVDSGSRRVDVNLVQEGKEWVLSFQDDGCGMTSGVFLERFLCLGGKGGGEASERTGGNGVAKAVILFNRYVKDFTIDSVAQDMHRFRVTQAEILAGAELQEQGVCPGKPGVVFVIRYVESTPVYMDYLREMLTYARPAKTAIFLNGQEIVCGMEPSALHTEIAGFPVYKPKEPKSYKGHLIVLSNGLPQFQEWVGGDETYVVDFTHTTYKDFTPARERLVNPTLEQAFRRLRERASYEKENPISSKIPPQKVQKRLAYNFRKSKAKKQTEAPKAPKDVTLYESFAPILEDERRAALVTSGIQSVVESQEGKANQLLEDLVPSRGVIFEDRSSEVRREWHPEKQKRVRKLLVLMDRYIEIFEEEFTDLEVANIGFMRNSYYSHDAHWSGDDKAVFLDIEKLDKKFQVAALQALYTLTHELAHRWEHSHNEKFATRQAQLLNLVARRAHEFQAARKEVRRIR